MKAGSQLVTSRTPLVPFGTQAFPNLTLKSMTYFRVVPDCDKFSSRCRIHNKLYKSLFYKNSSHVLAFTLYSYPFL